MRPMRKTNDAEIIEMLDAGKSQKEIAEHFGVSPPAICYRVKKIRPPELPPALTGLTEKEQKFVVARAEGKTLTQAALDSFECSTMDSAKNLGSRLAKRDDIQVAVSILLEEEGIGRRHRIRALKRHIDNLHDTQASLKGIDIANRMENLYVEKHVVLTPSWTDLCQDLDEVLKRKRELEEELGIITVQEETPEHIRQEFLRQLDESND